MSKPEWHYLQISDALDREFVSALSQLVRVTAWEPEMSSIAFLQLSRRSMSRQQAGDLPIAVRTFPLQKGYSRPSISWFARTGSHLKARLLKVTGHPDRTPLVLSTPYYASLAEIWPGPVIYYLTDLITAYDGADPELVRKLDRRMCEAAQLICPNSQRIADYLAREAGCDAVKICIIPNATRGANILPYPVFEPATLPADVADTKRPVAGIIGNMGENLNWTLLAKLIEGTPGFSWLMVGPTDNAIADERERTARERLLRMGGRVRFVGRKPYGELASYARCFDVAVLPYMLREPTYSGSSTRFYEHLAACRPIVATTAFEELLHKPPLLRLIETAEEGIQCLLDLQQRSFDDGQIEARWMASKRGTWETRAASMVAALAEAEPGNVIMSSTIPTIQV